MQRYRNGPEGTLVSCASASAIFSVKSYIYLARICVSSCSDWEQRRVSCRTSVQGCALCVRCRGLPRNTLRGIVPSLMPPELYIDIYGAQFCIVSMLLFIISTSYTFWAPDHRHRERHSGVYKPTHVLGFPKYP